MAETTLLRSTAIVANASVGVSRPPPVNAGALPLVQVKPVAPSRVQEGQQQQTVTILPPKDTDSAVKTGGLPMVKIKMTDGKPKPDDGMHNNVVIKDNRNTVSAGGLPMVQVRMEQGRPQVQSMPNVQNARPQIPSAPPTALSQPRVARIAAPAPVQLRPQAPTQPYGQPHVQVSAPTAVSPPELSVDELMLSRHALDKYLSEQRGDDAGVEASDNVKIAESAIGKFDQMIEAAATAPVEVPVGAVVDAPAAAQFAVPSIAVNAAPVRVASVGYVPPASYTQRPRTIPTNGYVAPRPGGHSRVNMRGNASLAPRRVARTGQAPLPTVQVKMDGGNPIVQNQADIATAREAKAQAELQARAEALVAAAPPPMDPTPQQVEVLAAKVQAPPPESQPVDNQG
jgi:hypothetical protein